MRRNLTAFRLLVPVVGLGLVLAGCGDSGTTGAKRTVTVMETYTSGADGSGAGSGSAQSGSGTAGGSGVTVVVPSDESGAAGSDSAGTGEPAGSGQPSGTGDAAASGTDGSGAGGTAEGSKPAESSAKATTSAETSESAETSASAGGDLKDVDPLTISCPPIITQHDIKVATGVTVANKNKRIKDVANKKVDSSGSIRCLYGLQGSEHKLSMRVTQYKNAAAAEKQSGVTVEAEEGLGAQISEVEVGGQPATVMVRDGGLISMQYDDWTLSIAAVDGWMKKDVPGQLTKLADVALKRILQTAD